MIALPWPSSWYISTSSATLCALWYPVVTALSVAVQKFRRKLARQHGRGNYEGLGCSSCLSEVCLEFIWFSRLRVMRRTALRRWKGQKDMKVKYRKIRTFHWFCFPSDSMLEEKYSSKAKGLQCDSRSKIIDTKK